MISFSFDELQWQGAAQPPALPTHLTMQSLLRRLGAGLKRGRGGVLQLPPGWLYQLAPVPADADHGALMGRDRRVLGH